MKKNIFIQMGTYNIDLITNGEDEFDKIAVCFHGFNGDKWGDAYSGLKKRIDNALVVSFNSCGHGDSMVKAEDMRLDLILEEIDVVIKYFQENYPLKKLVFVAVSYGAYRVFQYLIKYKPNIHKVIYINPAFRILETLENLKEFKYALLKDGDMVPMKRSLNKFMSKAFLDDLYQNNLFNEKFDISYDSEIVFGTKDTLIPRSEGLEIAEKYNYKVTYVDDYHCFENKENWDKVVDIIKEMK